MSEDEPDETGSKDADVVALRPAVYDIEVDIHLRGLRADVVGEVLAVFAEKFPDARLVGAPGKQPFMRYSIPIRVEGRARRLP